MQWNAVHTADYIKKASAEPKTNTEMMWPFSVAPILPFVWLPGKGIYMKGEFYHCYQVKLGLKDSKSLAIAHLMGIHQ